MQPKLAIITTHPIQYNAPFFKHLASNKALQIKVFYTWSQTQSNIKFDPGFGKNIEWDIPLLDGYDYTFSKNVANEPGSHHYNGISNPTLINEIIQWGANAVLVYGWAFKSHFKVMRYFKNKIPVFFRGDSTIIDEAPFIKKIFRKYFLKFIYHYIDVAMYAGQANKQYFEHVGLPKSKLVFVPHCIDNDVYKQNNTNVQAAAKWRTSLQIPTSAIVFLFVGKFETKKQPDVLLQTFVEINNPNTHIIMVGSGVLEAALKAQYTNFANIHFLGFQNQTALPAIYAMCNVFVLPSKGPAETWGLAINEAMAAGKAIIASNACGGSYDLVKQNVSGFVFEKNNHTQLKKYMEFFVDNGTASLAMGQQSLHIIQQYSYTFAGNALINAVKTNGKI